MQHISSTEDPQKTGTLFIPLYSRVLLFPPDGKPTMVRLVGMDVGRKSATDHQLEGSPSIFKTIEYLVIDTRHVERRDVRKNLIYCY